MIKGILNGQMTDEQSTVNRQLVQGYICCNCYALLGRTGQPGLEQVEVISLSVNSNKNNIKLQYLYQYRTCLSLSYKII